MTLKYAAIIWCFSTQLCVAQQTYCPSNHGLIDVGMTMDQVLAACGTPTVRQQSDGVVTQKIPVTQLIYSTLNPGAVYQGLDPIYTMWSLPSGSNGVNFQVNIINNKISSMTMNGSSVNSSTLCGGTSLQGGDDVSAVYSACGSPSLVNNTYINQPILSKNKPEIWIYQTNQYSPLIRLTFLDGKLQSID